MSQSRFPAHNEVVAFEYNCQLVHHSQGSPIAPASAALSYPDVQLPADHQSEFLEGSVPVIHIPPHLASQLVLSPKQPRSARAQQAQEASSSSPWAASTSTAPWHDDGRTTEQGAAGWQSMLSKGLAVVWDWMKQQVGSGAAAPSAGLARPPPFAWHPHRPCLAVADGNDRVHLYGLEAAEGVKGGHKEADLLLYHEFQRKVGALAWRPRSGTMLAVGCQHGVCLWTVGRGPMGATALRKSAPGGGAWMTFLKMPAASQVDSLSFSPDGAQLAACCWDSAELVVWDVATGVSHRVRSANSRLFSVVWSPCGNYIFAAGLNAFYLWETHSWRCEQWDCTLNGSVTRAAWAASGQTLLLSFQGSASTLQALHFVEPAPSLKTQMLPVALPECLPAGRDAAAHGPARSPPSFCMHDFAWDPTGQRLALLLGPPHVAAGTVAVYSVVATPLISAKFVGYGRLPKPAATAPDDGDKGVGELQFVPCYKQGALLSVRQDANTIVNIPLHFAALL